MICLNVVLSFVFITNVACDETADVTTVETLFAETTTEAEIHHIDLDDDDVMDAMNLDYGVYTTMRFRYINSQYDNVQPIDKCQEDYIKCLTTQGVAIPVCAYNWMDDSPRKDGFFTADSYCDVYFDNCRRHIRFWRILDYGTCEYLTRDPRYWEIPMTIRRFSEVSPYLLWKKLLQN